MKTIHANIYRNGRVIHRSTIRSDWKLSDFEALNKTFPNACIKSTRLSIPLWYLALHGFNHIKKLQVQ